MIGLTWDSDERNGLRTGQLRLASGNVVRIIRRRSTGEPLPNWEVWVHTASGQGFASLGALADALDRETAYGAI